MKTLADMTPEERAKCVGMWFDTIFGLGILEALQEEPKEGDPFGRFTHPDRGSWHTETLKGLTPRHDLPRAWNPDGTPLQAARETCTGDDGLYLDDDGTMFLTTPGTIYKRWVTDWEVAE